MNRLAANRQAPLTPNGWLRLDAITRNLPAGVHDVLEIGCGQGALGVRLARRYRYTAVEPDPVSYAVAQHRIARTGLGTVHHGPATSVHGLTFDLVCAFEVLEHIDDDGGALAEWASLVRPGGWVLVSVPAYQHRYGPADELVGHVRRYDPATLRTRLVDAGLADVTVQHYGAPLGYLLEAGRNILARRRLAAAGRSAAERTAASGRLLQPSGPARGYLTQLGTAPFRLMQRGFTHTGPGLLVRARRPQRDDNP